MMQRSPAMRITSFRDLEVWQRSMVLAERVYTLTEGFPRCEQYGLTAQLRRAAVSIPSNIAEGHARRTGQYLYHLNVASGSDAELQTQLELASRLRLVSTNRVGPLLDESAEIGRMLRGLASSVARSRAARRSPP
jgi:four helix bundle protein